MVASLDNVIQQLQENKKQNQDSLTEIRSELTGVENVVDNVVELVSDVEKNTEKREKNQNRIEGGKKAYRTRMENLAKKEAEKFSLFRAIDAKAVEAFETLGEFAKKQYNATLAQVELIEKQRADANADKLKNLEALREAKLGGKLKAAKDVVGDKIEEPSFLKKIFKLALGIFGAAAFIKLVQNFDQVKAFTTDKLIPALVSTFNFLKDVLTPVFKFISDNFSGVVTGVLVAAGVVISAKIFIKLANLFKGIQIALLTIKSGTASLLGGLIATGKALVTAAAPFAIPIAIALGIAAVVAGIGFALTKLRDALGFGSIFDVLMLGVMHLKDAFGHVVNLVGSLVNFILGLVEKFGKFLGFKVDLPELPKMATDSAAEFKMGAQAQETVIKAKEKEEEGSSLAELEKRFGYDTVEEEPNVVVTRGGRLSDEQAAALESGMTLGEVMAMRPTPQQDLTPPQGAGGGNVANAVVNAPVSTTNVNNATTVMDAEPAIDGLDRFAMGSAF